MCIQTTIRVDSGLRSLPWQIRRLRDPPLAMRERARLELIPQNANPSLIVASLTGVAKP